MIRVRVEDFKFFKNSEYSSSCRYMVTGGKPAIWLFFEKKNTVMFADNDYGFIFQAIVFYKVWENYRVAFLADNMEGVGVTDTILTEKQFLQLYNEIVFCNYSKTNTVYVSLSKQEFSNMSKVSTIRRW